MKLGLKNFISALLLLLPVMATCEIRQLNFDISCNTDRGNECIATYKRVVTNNSSWNAEWVNYTEEQCQDVLGLIQGYNPNPYTDIYTKCTVNYGKMKKY